MKSNVTADIIIGEAPEAARLRELLDPTATDMGFVLVRLRYLGSEGRRTLQIMAERPDGTMDVGGCADLSRALSAVLDVEDPISGAYDLEVSSPGIDRPLSRLADFERYAGFEVKLEAKGLIDGRKRFRGILEGVQDGEVLLRLKLDGQSEEQILGFEPGLISTAKIVMTDDLLRQASEAREANLNSTEEEAVEVIAADKLNSSDG